MNPLMLQQVLSTARTLPGKTGGSASAAGSAASGSGDFAAVAQSALAGDTPSAQGKATAEELTNPLAALLLAALFAQTQPLMAETAQSGDTAQASDALMTGSVSSDDTAPALGASAPGEDLSALLQALGLSETDAQSFIQQLSAVLQAQPAAQPAPQSAEQIVAQPAAVTTTIGTTAPQTEGGETAIAQVRTLLDKLLGDAVVPQNAQTPAAPAAQLDTATALALRELLASLSDQGATSKGLQNAQSAPITPDAPQTAAPQAVAAATVGDQGSATQDDPSTGGDSNAASLANAAAQFVAAPRGDATADAQSIPQSAAQSTQRTLGEAFDSMVDTITSLHNNSKNEMEIQLKPDFLGKVVIHLTMEQGSLVARISASNAIVQDAFQAQAQQLTTALQQQGIRDVTVLVTHDTASGNALGQSTARQQPNSREQRRRSYQVSDVAEKPDAARATAAYEQFWRSGTINYLA